MDNDELLEKAKSAVTALFGDTSVSQSKTRENLRDLIGEIEVMLDTLRDNSDEG